MQPKGERAFVARKRSPSKMRAVCEDGACCGTSGKSTSLLQLVLERQLTYANACSRMAVAYVFDHVVRVYQCIGDDRLQAFINVERESFALLCLANSAPSNCKIQLPASSYVSGYRTPTVKKRIVDSAVRIPNSIYKL